MTMVYGSLRRRRSTDQLTIIPLLWVHGHLKFFYLLLNIRTVSVSESVNNFPFVCLHHCQAMGSDDAEDKHDNDEGKVEKKKKKKEKKERGKPRSRSRSRGRSRARRTEAEAKAHKDDRRRSSVRRSASTVGSSGGKAVLKPGRANPAEDTSGAASGSKSATAETGKDDGPAKAESPNPKLPMIRKSGPKMNGKIPRRCCCSKGEAGGPPVFHKVAFRRSKAVRLCEAR